MNTLLSPEIRKMSKTESLQLDERDTEQVIEIQFNKCSSKYVHKQFGSTEM